MRNLNYAITAELLRKEARETEYSITAGGKKESFHARENTENAVRIIANSYKFSDSLMYSAASALQRQSKSDETAEEWAERLSKEFFEDL